MTQPATGTLLKPAEVAAMFHVNPRTVARWADTRRVTCVRTPGGHRRYPRTEIEQLLARH